MPLMYLDKFNFLFLVEKNILIKHFLMNKILLNMAGYLTCSSGKKTRNLIKNH